MVIVLNICAIIESICKQSKCVWVTYMCEMCVCVWSPNPLIWTVGVVLH